MSGQGCPWPRHTCQKGKAHSWSGGGPGEEPGSRPGLHPGTAPPPRFHISLSSLGDSSRAEAENGGSRERAEVCSRGAKA